MRLVNFRFSLLIESVLAPTKATLVNREDSSHTFQPLFCGSSSIYHSHFDVIVHDYSRTHAKAVVVA